jgi:hypothetical protein
VGVLDGVIVGSGVEVADGELVGVAVGGAVKVLQELAASKQIEITIRWITILISPICFP